MLRKIRGRLALYSDNQNLSWFYDFNLLEWIFLVVLMNYYMHPVKNVKMVLSYILLQHPEAINRKAFQVIHREDDGVIVEALMLYIYKEMEGRNESAVQKAADSIYLKYFTQSPQ